MERAALERWLQEGLSLDEIGRRVGRHPSTVSYWLEKYGLSPAHQARHAPRGGIPRHALATLVEQHLTVREIAQEVGRSTATVRHWLRRYGLRTTREARLRAKRRTPAGERFAGICMRHGPTMFVVRPDNTSQCVRCRSEAVSARRRKVKEILVREAGGGCAICGYNRCLSALQFHHLDPEEKRFGLAARGIALGLARAREEAAKCVLLCANHHAEVEEGIANLPHVPSAPADHPA